MRALLLNMHTTIFTLWSLASCKCIPSKKYMTIDISIEVCGIEHDSDIRKVSKTTWKINC